MSAESVAGSVIERPIEGLRVSVLEDVAGNQFGLHEVIINKQGRPATDIVVRSDSDVTILSHEGDGALVGLSAAAKDLSASEPLHIFGIPLVEQVGACVGSSDSGYFAEFTYNNKSQRGTQINLPVTALNAELYGEPSTSEDDFLLNDIRRSDGEMILPDPVDLAGGPDTARQVFKPGVHSFTIPLHAGIGPIVWSLLGSTLTVDSTAPRCVPHETPVEQRCAQLTSADMKVIIKGMRQTVTAVLKTAARLTHKGTSPYVTSCPKALKRVIAFTRNLQGSFVCPVSQTIAQNCTRETVQLGDLFAAHESIFAKQSPVKPKVFQRLHDIYTNRFQQTVASSLPGEVIRCR